MSDFDPDWWKTLFDEVYLTTDARTVCDENLTNREVDFLERALGMEKSWAVLDLCGGQGRHALELSRRGFQDITSLDYAGALIDRGLEKAREEGLNTRFLRKDARETGLPDEAFRVIIVMAGSLGYFIDEAQNKKILEEAYRLILPGGILLLDLPNREHVLKNFMPASWHEADQEIVVCRQRRLEEDVIYCREMVVSKRTGLIRDANYCTRLYSSERIENLLKSVGFHEISFQKDFAPHLKPADYGLMTNRMVVMAGKEGERE
ncbi:class I SAM-dependent methyltransferase [Thermodesulfobacteriota bacterium]